MESELIQNSKFINKKIEELKSKFKESEELDALVSQGTARMTQCVLCLHRSTTTTTKDLNSILDTTRKVKDSLLEFEDKFCKYDIPNRGGSESFESYEERLREFMKAWKVESEKGREIGEKSLLELLRVLGDQKRVEAFKVVKDQAILIGFKISWLLGKYLWLLKVSTEKETVMKNVEEVRLALQCLTVDGNCSIFVSEFLKVLKLTDFAIGFKRFREVFRKIESVTWQSEETEVSEILRLILREVLRFEVAFRCPDLPMVVTDEVVVSMVCHLVKIFDKKLSLVNLKMDGLIARKKRFFDARDSQILNCLFLVMDVQIEQVWGKLDIQS